MLVLLFEIVSSQVLGTTIQLFNGRVAKVISLKGDAVNDWLLLFSRVSYPTTMQVPGEPMGIILL